MVNILLIAASAAKGIDGMCDALVVNIFSLLKGRENCRGVAA